MHVQRFKRCLVLCAVMSWVATGFYPFGMPLPPIDSGMPMNPFIEVPQVFAYAFLKIGGVLGMLVYVFVIGESLVADNGRITDRTMRRQGILSWAAPLAIFLAAGEVMRVTSEYMGGSISGLQFPLWFSLYLFLACNIAVFTVGVLHRTPTHERA